MSKPKRNTKSNPKTPSLSQHPLAALLLARHPALSQPLHLTNATALALQTVLTGSDEELQVLFEKWEDLGSVDEIVGSWVDSSAGRLIARLLPVLRKPNHLWAYPWLKAALARSPPLEAEDRAVLAQALASRNQAQLGDMLRLSGKLQLLDF